MSVVTTQVPAPASAPPQRRRARPDVTVLIVIYVLLLFLVPSNRVVAAVGSFGTPANFWGVIMLGVWATLNLAGSQRLHRRYGTIHLALLLLAIAVIGSYVAAMSIALTGKEASAADRALLSLLSWSGVVLLVADGLSSRERIQRITQWVAGLLVIDSLLAISQYLLRRDILAQIPVPGLVVNYVWGIDERSEFVRVVGTALHSIEFGVVQTMGLALTLHWAFYASTKRARILWGVGAAIMLAALPLTISRSAMINFVIVAVVLLPTWPRRRRRRALLLAPVGLVALRLVYPGVLGTILSLFTYFSVDPSTTGRTSDYAQVVALIQENIWFGRGAGTFLPELYFILDNQYLLSLVSTGIIGLMATIFLMLVGPVVAWTTRAKLHDPADRDVAVALLAGLCVAAVSWALFDGFSFPQATGLFFLILGLTGAYSRAATTEEVVSAPRSWRTRLARLGPPLAVSLALMALLIPRVGTGGSFVAERSYLLHNRDVRSGLFTQAYELTGIASIATTYLNSAQGRAEVADLGGTSNYVAAQGQDSLANPAERPGFGPIIRTRVTGASPQEVLSTQQVLDGALRTKLSAVQQEAGAPTLVEVIARDLSTSDTPGYLQGSRKRALVGALLFAGLCGMLVWLVTQLTIQARPRAGTTPKG